jgi:hypothetical protein
MLRVYDYNGKIVCEKRVSISRFYETYANETVYDLFLQRYEFPSSDVSVLRDLEHIGPELRIEYLPFCDLHISSVPFVSGLLLPVVDRVSTNIVFDDSIWQALAFLGVCDMKPTLFPDPFVTFNQVLSLLCQKFKSDDVIFQQVDCLSNNTHFIAVVWFDKPRTERKCRVFTTIGIYNNQLMGSVVFPEGVQPISQLQNWFRVTRILEIRVPNMARY